jgi:sensor histidine kinase regulating citrate/malate metabolism
MTLRLKMALLVTLMIGAIAGFINLYLPARMEARMLAYLQTEAGNAARMASFSVAPALVFGDRASGADALRGVEVLTDLSYVVVEDASGARFAAVHPERMAASSSGGAGTGAVDLVNSVHRVSQPVMHERVAIGTIHVGISLDSMRNEVVRMRHTIGWISLFVFLAGLAVTIGISTYVTRPLVKMVGTAEEIAAGDWQRRAPIGSRDEAGQLALSFNAMLDRLDEARSEREELNHALERRVEERTAELQQEVQERRRGEAALQISNERFMLAAAAVDGVLYDWDIREDRVIWTDGLTRVFGYSRSAGGNSSSRGS